MGILIFLGLFALFVGAALTDYGTATIPGEPQADVVARANARLYGAIVGHFGMFLLVMGLLGAAVFFVELDVFARLFLLILAFVSVLLILTGSTTIFGVP